MDYAVYTLSFLVIYAVLGAVLYTQFTLAGIVNFGIAGFWGLGMYLFTLIQVNFNIGFIPALLLTVVVAGLVSLLLGRLILHLDSQSVLVSTLAFAKILESLASTEKWLTRGVMGIGTVFYPIQGEYEGVIYLGILIVLAVLTFLYLFKLQRSSYGRMLISIGDNERLAKGLGKPTLNKKTIFFGVTCAIIAAYGAFAVPLYAFIFPRMIGASTTFTVWIILMLGGRNKLYGAIVGAVVAYGILDILLGVVIPLPAHFASTVSDIRYALFGLVLVIVMMLRPSGIVGDKKSKNKRMAPVL